MSHALSTHVDRRITALAWSARREIDLMAYQARLACGCRPLPILSSASYPLPAQFKCPECGKVLKFEVYEWASDEGEPIRLHVMCDVEEMELVEGKSPLSHQHWWSDWDCVTVRGAEWVQGNCRVRNAA